MNSIVIFIKSMSHFLVPIFSFDYFSHCIGKIPDTKELKQSFILDHDSRLYLKLVVEVSIVVHMIVIINMKHSRKRR